MKNKLILLSILSLFLFATCKKEYQAGPAGPAGPSGPAGPLLTGDIIGFISLFDVDGNMVVDKSGVTVSLEGTKYSTSTNKDGRFVLSQIVSGNYFFIMSKPGYGYRKRFSIPFVGGGPLFVGTLRLEATPSFTVSGLSVKPDPNNGLFISGTINQPIPTNPQIRIFIDTTALVSFDPKHYVLSTTSYNGKTPGFSINLTRDFILSSGIKSGQIIYLVAYPDGGGTYPDQNTGKDIYTNLNPTPSNITSITAP